MSQDLSNRIPLSKNHSHLTSNPTISLPTPPTATSPNQSVSRQLNHHDACGICKRGRQGLEVRGRGNSTYFTPQHRPHHHSHEREYIGPELTIPHRNAAVSNQEMADARLPLAYRDKCAHLLVPLNRCRYDAYYLPWKCEVYLHQIRVSLCLRTSNFLQQLTWGACGIL